MSIRQNIPPAICIVFIVFSTLALGAVGSREQYLCKKIDTPLKIDGRLDDWWGHKPLALALVFPDNISIPDRRGPQDMDVICYLLWDEQYLYLAAEVTDDKHIAWLNSSLWQADSFQIAFDPKNNSINEPRYGPEDIEINFTATDDGRSYAEILAHENVKLIGRVPADKMLIRYKRNRDDTAGVFEVAIPWSILKPIEPKISKVFGFNVLYNERDDNIRRGWVSWTPGIGELKNAWFFNKIKLTGNNEKTDTQPFLSTGQRYFKKGETAIISCYIPYYDVESAKVKLLFTVSNGSKEIYTIQKQLTLKRGMNRADFAYKIEQNIEPALTAGVKISSRSFHEPDELRIHLKSLSAEVLKARAADIQKRNNGLSLLIKDACAKGVDVTYPKVTPAIVGLFLKYRLADLNDKEKLLKYKYLDTIEKQLNYLDSTITKALDEVNLLMKTPDIAMSVPVVDMTKISIKRGQFCDADGKAVMLLGPAGWDKAFDDIEFYREMGFNLIGDTITPGGVVPSPGKYISGYIDRRKRHLRLAQDNNMAEHFLCSPHPTPSGWLKAYPDMKGSNGFINACYYSKGFREMIRQYWGRLIPALCDEPALLTWDMANEWFNREGTKSLHPKMRIRFYNFLREKYNDISGLNAVWHTSYKNFDEIKPLEFRRQSQPGPYYDWEYFRQGEGLNVIKFFADTIRRYDPVTPLTIKIIADTDFGGGPFGRVGVEREDVDDVLEIAGLDVGTAVNFNLLKSLHPNRPVMETEVHTSIHLKPEADVLRLWHTYLSGQSGRVLWGCINLYSAEMKAAGAYLHIPWTLEATARTGLDIRRLSSEIALFQDTIANAEVGILYSPVSRILEERHLHTAVKVFEAVSKLDAPVRFISEKQISEGQLSRLKLLVVPDATFVHRETFDKIVQFAQSARMVVATGQSLTRDPYDNLYPVRELTAAGVKSVEGRINKETFDAVFNVAAVDRKLRILRTDGQKKENIETRITREKKGILAYVINRGPAQKLTFNFKCKNMITKDLISGRKLDSEFTIEPSAVMIIRLHCGGELQVTPIRNKPSIKLPAFAPQVSTAARGKLTEKEKKELEVLRKKLLEVPHNNCTGRDDLLAVDGQASYRDKRGIYVWWAGAGRQLKRGKYRVFARLKVDASPEKKIFTLCVVDESQGKSLKKMKKIISNTEYREVEIGTFEYDKTYPLRLSDWSSPGIWVDYVYLVPISQEK